MNRTTRYIAVAAAAFCVLLGCPTAQAVPITSAATGQWELAPTWTGGGVPGLGDTALINHTVTMDMVDGINGDETTLADVQVNVGGSLYTWMGDAIVANFTFNGGTLGANQRTMDFIADSVTVNNVAGNTWTQKKNQNSKHAEIHTPTLSGAGDLAVQIGHAGQLFQLDVTSASGTTGYTGTLNVTRMNGRYNTASETDSAHLRINKSITQADASFDLVLNAIVRDWTEAGGGTGAPDDGISYNGYDIRVGAVEVWVTSLTIGGYSVPSRATAYTYAELAVMNGGDVDNFLRSDGTDGTLGVTPEPATMALLGLGACALVVRRKRRRV